MLDNIRVIEIGQAFSAPFAAQILGFLGAEVIKIERPGGDDTRDWGERLADGSSMIFHSVNRNKKSVVLDLKNPDDKARLEELIGTADVFVHNLRPGSAEKLGLGGESLLEKFPRLIYAELGAFGHLGPMRHEAGYEMLMQAFSGIMSITGEADGIPVRCGPSICDFGSGMWLALGMVAALNRRLQTGEGCIVSSSIYETALNWISVASGDYLGHAKEPERVGNGHPALCPYGLFQTKDSALILGAGNDRLFEKLVKVLNREDLMDDPRFQTNGARIKNRKVVEGEIAAILLRDATQHWVSVITEAGVPCSPLNTIPEALEHPQTKALKILQAADNSPELQFIGLPLSFNGERPKLRNAGPNIGEDTEAVLGSAG